MNKARSIPCFTALALLGLAGCSDAVPPAAQGAASFHLGAPTMMGASCPAQPHWSNAPFVSFQATVQTVTLDSKGPALAVDGQNGAQVACSVKGRSDGKFDISATISAPVMNKQSNNVGITAVLGAQDSMGTGSVAVSDDATTNLVTSSDCVFAARPTDQNGNPGVSPGKVWATATCKNGRVNGSADATSLCDISPAVFVFENCGQ